MCLDVLPLLMHRLESETQPASSVNVTAWVTDRKLDVAIVDVSVEEGDESPFVKVGLRFHGSKVHLVNERTKCRNNQRAWMKALYSLQSALGPCELPPLGPRLKLEFAKHSNK
jgi:hypothetical protein